MNDTAAPNRPTTLAPAAVPDPLRGALLDSRQRWRDLVTLSADFAFETDAWGRLVFVMPDPALGWAASLLVGQPAELLLADSADGVMFNPFRVTAPVRRRRAWIKRADGRTACLNFAAAPLLDANGHISGARGVGVDMTDSDIQGAQVAAALRRGEVLDHILWRMGREVLAPRMMGAALDALVNALGAEGTAVIVTPTAEGAAQLAHQAGIGAEAVLHAAASLLATRGRGPLQTTNLDGRSILLVCCQTRFGADAGLTAWRAADARPWDHEDRLLIGSAGNIIRMVLEHESIQREMVRQARTDPLTGLLNRRAFLEEMERHTDRLDREGLPGTLMFADLDHFKPVNDKLGHEVGDQVLVRTAELLRRIVRPSDLVARLGGDEFAVWMSGADHMTAAERADYLREAAPEALREIVGGDAPRLSMSIGIATRRPGGKEPIDSLIRRADMAMYEVKRHGRGHWRVSLQDGG